MCYHNSCYSWSINCYTQDMAAGVVLVPGSLKTDIIMLLPFSDLSEDISFHEPVESSFSHQALLLNDTAPRKCNTLSHKTARVV